jgi:cinnamoyl-CoA:phenyllactate CoA-transferase
MSTQRPLDGIKVIDMSTFIGAPACARFFAEFGAEVIKIEPKSGDLVRFNGVSEGRLGTPYENTTWDLENAHKKGLVLDLKSPEGREILFKLLETTDIFITNWRPQAIAKLGLDYESLKDKFPKLVYASFTGYGETGPDCNLPGYDFTSYWARSGLQGTSYQKGTEPINLVPGIGDHTTGMFLAAGIMVALYNVQKTGKGDKVEINLLHSAIWTQGIPLQAAQYTELGTKYPTSRTVAENPFNNTYKTSDGRFIQLSMPPFDVFYPTFMPVIGHPELVGNPRYTMKSITENKLHGEFIAILDEAFAQKTAAEWVDILTKADIPHSICQVWEEVLEDEQAWAIGAFEKVKYLTGERTMVRLPVTIKGSEKRKYARGPFLGEHSEEIIRQLGYTDEQINELHEKKIFFTWDDQREKFGGNLEEEKSY